MIRTTINTALYALGLCLIAGLLTFFGINEVLTIGLVSVLSASVALWLRNTKAFDKTAVDLIYYGIAFLGVFVYFWQETAIRDVKAVESNILKLTRALAEAQDAILTFDDQTAHLKSIATQRTKIKAKLRDDPEKTLTAVREIEINATIRMPTAQALTCAEAFGHYKKDHFEENRQRGRLYNHEFRKEQARQVCDDYMEDLQRRKEIARTKRISLSDLTDSASRFKDIGDALVPAEGMELSISMVIDILQDRDLLAGRTEQRRILKESANTADQILKTAIANRSDDIATASKGAPHFMWNLRYKGWPVVVILLLSLKLARSRIPKETRHEGINGFYTDESKARGTNEGCVN